MDRKQSWEQNKNKSVSGQMWGSGAYSRTLHSPCQKTGANRPHRLHRPHGGRDHRLHRGHTVGFPTPSGPMTPMPPMPPAIA